MANRNLSLVHWFPELERHKCGYCKNISSNCSYGMWAEILSVEDYQYLIDRGWRRSGKYCYKPVMDTTCCPLYTIKCEALNFKLSKSQKRNIKRVNRYLSESFTDSSVNDRSPMESDENFSEIHPTNRPERINIDRIQTDQLNLPEIDTIPTQNVEQTEIKTNINTMPQAMHISTSSLTKDAKEHKPGTGADPSKPPCKKAKLLRLERRQQKLAAKGIDSASVQHQNAKSEPKRLEEYIDDVSKTPVHKLKVILVRTGGLRTWTDILSQEHPVYRKYQMAVHGDPPEKCSEKQFTNFLLESPLQHYVDPSGPRCGYGSFHQQYWLDDKLIAVGVIDILPKCVSSVYFFYDPDYRHLTLGTYGSLRELYFVRDLHTTAPDIVFYYMGFYIHSCPKMRYKANLTPSYLLCPETYKWFPIELCIPKLNQAKYCRFNDDLDAIDDDACSTVRDLDNLKILISYNGWVTFKNFKEQHSGLEDEFLLLGSLIGKKCVPRIMVASKHSNF